jgi:hypothetical protein
MLKTLYSVISELGREKIQRDITLNREKSKEYIQTMLAGCLRIPNFTTTETTGILCEALLHFMLTATTIPSVRKVVFDGIKLDIVIPNIHTLRNYPDKALVIQIVKEDERISKEEQKKIKNIQPNLDNMWVVSKEPLPGEYINYTVDIEYDMKTSMRRCFDDIIIDIGSFLERIGDRSFRFFH